MAAMNGAIDIGGVPVCNDDMVFADEDGVVVVPRASAAQVYERLQAVLEKEAAMEARVTAGVTYPDWLDGVLDGPDIVFVEAQ